MNLTPPADRVLIRQCEPETETTFGLMLPQTALKESQRGIVVAVGQGLPDPLHPGVRIPLGIYNVPGQIVEWSAGLDPCLGQIMPGDEVVLPRFGGTEIDWNGEVLVSVLASEVLAVVAA